MTRGSCQSSGTWSIALSACLCAVYESAGQGVSKATNAQTCPLHARLSYSPRKWPGREGAREGEGGGGMLGGGGVERRVV